MMHGTHDSSPYRLVPTPTLAEVSLIPQFITSLGYNQPRSSSPLSIMMTNGSFLILKERIFAHSISKPSFGDSKELVSTIDKAKQPTNINQ